MFGQILHVSDLACFVLLQHALWGLQGSNSIPFVHSSSVPFLPLGQHATQLDVPLGDRLVRDLQAGILSMGGGWAIKCKMKICKSAPLIFVRHRSLARFPFGVHRAEQPSVDCSPDTPHIHVFCAPGCLMLHEVKTCPAKLGPSIVQPRL